MTAFKSGALDHGGVAKRREELFGTEFVPDQGAKNGVDTTPKPEPKTEPGHYAGELTGLRERLYGR